MYIVGNYTYRCVLRVRKGRHIFQAFIIMSVFGIKFVYKQLFQNIVSITAVEPSEMSVQFCHTTR